LEIPGYKIQREIGRGRHTRVYQAMQHAFGRAVAIKVLEAPDAESKERFFDRARIAAGLDHPNIVRVHDVGWSGDVPYAVMELVRGGDLDRNLESGLHMQNVLMAVKEVASALDYAHGKGVVHGDVKPSNILFNEQGTALLADFGVPATPAGASPKKADPVLGTPAYMSTEQAAGGVMDGRSDFYGLGVVLFQVLTGRLPFNPVSEAAARYPHGKIPPLPLQYAAFEAVLEVFLAESPDDRFSSGREIAAALDEIRDDGRIPDAVIKNGPFTAREITAVADSRERRRAAAETGGTARPRPVAGWVAGVLVVAVLLAGIYVGTNRELSERVLATIGVVDNPDVVVAWQEAEKLRQDASQGLDNLVAAYRDVLALDPTHAGATDAVAALAVQWKQDVGTLIDTDDLGLAGAKLSELEAVFPDDGELTALYDRIDASRRARRLLVDTNRQLAHAGLADARSVDNAIAHYEEVLRLDPGNVEALGKLDEIAGFYVSLAQQFALDGDVARSVENLERAVDANDEFQGLEAARATLSDAEALQAEIDDMLGQAADLRQAGALIHPPGSNAAQIYSGVLAIRPDDPVARQGMAGIVAEVFAAFEDMLSRGSLEEAEQWLEHAAESGIGDEPVDELSARYDAELARIRNVNRLVQEAELFYEQGYITGPVPEDNAVTRLSEALRLDPDNADANRLMSMAGARLARVATEAYNAGMTEEGMHYMDLALTVAPGSTRWRERRLRWEAESRTVPTPSRSEDRQATSD